MISKLRGPDKEWRMWEDELQETIADGFNEIFKVREVETDLVVGLIPSTLTEEQNNELPGPVDDEEVRRAVFSLGGEKSLGPDELNPAFYQAY